MSKPADISSTIAHAVLSVVASNGIRGWTQQETHQRKTYTSVGMHANLFIHGILGIIHENTATFNLDVKQLYDVSTRATQCLPIAFLNADLYNAENSNISTLHLASGLIPFLLSLHMDSNENLVRLCMALNIVSLAYYSFDKKMEWGYFTTVAALLTYFGAKQIGPVMYPLGLAAMEFCTYKMFGY